MIKYSFATQSDSETKRLAEYISSFEPKILFIIQNSLTGLHITATFNSEEEKNDFVSSLSSALNITDNGFYLK